MKNAARLTFTLLALLAPLAGSRAYAGPIGLIDDYADTDLSNYTFYKILDQGAGTTNSVYSSPSGSLQAISAGTTGAEQVLFLRNSGEALSVGEELRVDGPGTRVGTANDLGLAVSKLPVGLGNAAGDNRAQADFLFISYRNTNQLNSRGFNNGAEITQVQNFGVNATGLFIARTGATSAELGWYDGLTRNVSRTFTVASTDIFNYVGFYSDLRNDAGGFTGLDNLRITAIVPEPAAVAMASVALLGLAVVRRRK